MTSSESWMEGVDGRSCEELRAEIRIGQQGQQPVPKSSSLLGWQGGLRGEGTYVREQDWVLACG